VATVNGVEVSRAQFERLLQSNIAQYRANGQELTDQNIASLAPVVLESLINQEVLFQESRRRGIEVSESEIQSQIATMREEYGSEEALSQALAAQGVTGAELAESVEQSIAVQKLLQRQLGDRLQVDDREIRQFYEQNPESFRRPEQVRVRHILISTEDLSSEEEKAAARERIGAIRGRALAGEDFAELASAYSEGPSRQEGGDLGYFPRGEMVEPFERAAFSVPVGDISGIIETRFGYHVLKVLDRRDEAIVPLSEEVEDRVRTYLLQQKSQQLVAGYVESLKEDAEITRNL
jgi:peptidyl-prolyl cis-trans isomerase C